MNNSIIVKDIYKNYKDVKALDNISFEVKKGELFGFIGPDGGGKTTLFRIITTLLLPDKGSVEMEGMDVVKEYKKIRKIVAKGLQPMVHAIGDLAVHEVIDIYSEIDKYTRIRLRLRIEPAHFADP